MTLQLDARRRAMLREIGISVWQPAATPRAIESIAQEPAPKRSTGLSSTAAAPEVTAASLVPPSGLDALAWPELRVSAAACTGCALHGSRRAVVTGAGDAAAQWLFVGEAPDDAGDLAGTPFAGRSGRLLDAMLAALGLARDRGAFVAHAVMCRPPANRGPLPEEIAACEAYLRRQVALVQPRVIVAMGGVAAQALLRDGAPIGQLRGRAHSYQDVPVVVTYHLGYLLTHAQHKARVWADLCLAAGLLDERAASGQPAIGR